MIPVEERHVKPLPPAMRLEVGSIVTLRMRGHSRTNGQEYYAPAVVLNQYPDDLGTIEALVWDSSAGTHYNGSYPTRELGIRGDGPDRETFELQSNIGQVLFSPDQFALVILQVDELQARVARIEKKLSGTGAGVSTGATLATATETAQPSKAK